MDDAKKNPLIHKIMPENLTDKTSPFIKKEEVKEKKSYWQYIKYALAAGLSLAAAIAIYKLYGARKAAQIINKSVIDKQQDYEILNRPYSGEPSSHFFTPAVINTAVRALVPPTQSAYPLQPRPDNLMLEDYYTSRKREVIEPDDQAESEATSATNLEEIANADEGQLQEYFNYAPSAALREDQVADVWTNYYEPFLRSLPPHQRTQETVYKAFKEAGATELYNLKKQIVADLGIKGRTQAHKLATAQSLLIEAGRRNLPAKRLEPYAESPDFLDTYEEASRIRVSPTKPRPKPKKLYDIRELEEPSASSEPRVIRPTGFTRIIPGRLRRLINIHESEIAKQKPAKKKKPPVPANRKKRVANILPPSN